MKQIIVSICILFSVAASAQQQPVPVADTVAVLTTNDVTQILWFIRDKVKSKMMIDEWDKVEQAIVSLVEQRKKEWLELEAKKQKGKSK